MIKQEAGQLRVSGPLTMGTVAALMDIDLSGAEDRLVIDLGQVEAVDSAAVSLLLVWVRSFSRKGVRPCFANLPDNLSSLARLYGVAELLPLCGKDDRA
mgnify:CR=1 FL=1